MGARFLLAFSSAGNNASVNLGLQHRRGMVLPYAVDSCSGDTAVFHVAPLDGCSSLRAPTSDFKTQNRETGQTPEGMSWPKWVEDTCSRLLERRVVPCISLATVIGEWLGGRHIARIKVDAQGSDLDVIKSAGTFMNRLRYVSLEVQSRLAAPLYHGQASCEQVLQTMRHLGFQVADTRKLGAACNMSVPELDLDFVRREVAFLWRSFHREYAYCRVFSASGACGGPHCLAPQIPAQVNRTTCDSVQDELLFEPVVGMALIAIAPECTGNVQVERSEGLGLVVRLHQGGLRKRTCPVRSSFIPSLHGPMVRIQVGRGGALHGRLVILPGIVSPAVPLSNASMALTHFMDATSDIDVELLWPEPCSALRSEFRQQLTSQYAMETPLENFCAFAK